MTPLHPHNRLQFFLTLISVLLLAFFFAKVEIQIEGPAGWAANLPTWRIEQHWLLDIFWGGRPMTGYHAWAISFIGLFFHLPLIFMQQWSRRLEARVIACFLLFWITEDFLWFVFNPAFGLAQFNPEQVPWHVHWFLGAPVDYWAGLSVTGFLFWYSYRGKMSSGQALT